MSNYKTWLKTAVTLGTLLFSIFSIVMSYQSWTTSIQANNIALQGNSIAIQANNIANSAYSVANNYVPYIDVSSTGLLILRLVDCTQDASSTRCGLGGMFRVNFTIIAPHAGLANVTSVALTGLGPFSQQGHFQVGAGLESVQVGNATIITYPPMRIVSSTRQTVMAGQPVQNTLEVEIAGLGVTVPSTSMGTLNVTGFCTLIGVLTYFDVPFQRSVPRSFTIQAQIMLVRP